MFYVGQSTAEQSIVHGNYFSFKHKTHEFWNLVHPRLTHTPSAQERRNSTVAEHACSKM